MGHATAGLQRTEGLVADGRRLAALAVAGAGAALLLFLFYDRFWWGPDEGAYAYVAERILHGDVLNRDVQDMHAGYINFVNALAFRVFGVDLVSLRYPLVLLGLVQALLVFRLLEPRGLVLATVGSIAFTALGFVQFPNPTANHYGIFLTVAVVWMLARVDLKQALALEALGFLLVMTFLFRQLTGVVVAMGAVTWLLLSMPALADSGRPWLGRAALGIMAAGLAVFLLAKTDIVGGLLFGLWPLLVLIQALRRLRADDRAVLALIGRLTLGGAVALAPLLAYHLWHGSLGPWLDDTVGGALALNAMPFTRRIVHAAMIVLSVQQLLALDSLDGLINALFWLSVLALPVANGLFLLRQADDSKTPLLTVAVFHGLVSVFHQIPTYLMFSTGLSLVAFVATVGARGARPRLAALAFACIAAVIAVHYHAAQPATRLVREYVTGLRLPEVVESGLPRVSLRIEPADAEAHRRLVALIAREVPDSGAILAVPFEPQLYVLSGRRNPVRFYNTAIGLRDEAALAATLAILERDRPTLLFFRPDDKYNTALSLALMERLMPRYAPIDRIGGLEVYRLRR